MNKLVESIVNHESKEYTNKTLKLSFVSKAAPLFIVGDSTQITRMISNLIANALQYTLEGEIRVSTFATNDQTYACLQIEDTGIGISADELPLIFESFFRGQMLSQLNVPGIGMGLTIVKRIVDFHGGKISVQSQPDKGSTFLVRLPAYLNTNRLEKS